MVVLRRLLRDTALILALVLTGCGVGTSGSASPDLGELLADGRRYTAEWVSVARAGSGTDREIDPEIAVAVGYLERLRLGLGSPFRLIDQALHDPRLPDPVRRRTAYALLARTIDRHSYQIEPAALDLIGAGGAEWVPGVGRKHLELIDDAIRESADPRVGELAVRLAYTLAAAEKSVSAEAPIIAAQAAALIRDRELAVRDLARLFDRAAEIGVDPIDLVGGWRGERAFLVEAPTLHRLEPRLEGEAIEFGLRLARSIVALEPIAPGSGKVYQASSGRAGQSSLLGSAGARTLRAVARSLDAPPRTPVVMAVDTRRPEIRSPWLDRRVRAAWKVFIEGARGEEELVAEYHLLLSRAPEVRARAGATLLAAAAGLRTYAQERVWFPGYGGPTTRELQDRFGLSSVTFDQELPAPWRPYYRRVLADALVDLQRVFPSLNLRGLSFHFGRGHGSEMTLALHDPQSRTIYLAPETGMGTIAHEIAHDLDWQVAIRRYRVRGDYASDRAVRESGDRLADLLRRLTEAPLYAPIPGDPRPIVHAHRPAEVFARSIDWFVLVTLAGEGRSNGYLTSAQDPLLTGYGTARPPEITGSQGLALVQILDEIAPVYPSTREWFLESYGPNRGLGPYDLIRQIVEAEPGPILARKAARPSMVSGAEVEGEGPGEDAVMGPRLPLEVTGWLEEIIGARERAYAVVDARSCRSPVQTGDERRLSGAHRRLIAAAAEARALGLALDYAQRIGGRGGREWLVSRLGGGEEDGGGHDSVTVGILEALAREVVGLGERVGGNEWSGGLPWTTSSEHCIAVALGGG